MSERFNPDPPRYLIIRSVVIDWHHKDNLKWNVRSKRNTNERLRKILKNRRDEKDSRQSKEHWKTTRKDDSNCYVQLIKYDKLFEKVRDENLDQIFEAQK